MIKMENAHLKVDIETYGGTICHLFCKDTDVEYMWQGKDGEGGISPNLFPIVGRQFEQKYTVNGTTYEIGLHGILWKTELEVEQQETDSCLLFMKSTEETKKSYPFDFEFRLGYHLENCTVKISFEVKNTGKEVMYCGFGGHPGFNVPLEKGLNFEDYTVRFEAPCKPEWIEMSDNVLVTTKRTLYPMKNEFEMALHHNLFTRDAIVLTNIPHSVSIVSDKGKCGVNVSFPTINYVGIWQPGHGEPSMICIEPWSILPGREGVVEELCTIPNITYLQPGEIYTCPWEITVW